MKLRAVPALLAIAALLAAASGCGGDDSDSETTAAQETTTAEQQGGSTPQQRPEQQGGSQDGRNQGTGGQGPPSGGVVENPTNEQLGVTSGGDNSLQRFGTTAEDEERDEVVRRMRGFFRALTRGPERACPYFTDTYVESLEQLATSATGQSGQPEDGCAALGQLLSRSPSGALVAEARRGITATVLRVGIEDDQAIIMLRERSGQLAYFTMTREDDEWKTSTLSIVRLPG